MAGRAVGRDVPALRDAAGPGRRRAASSGSLRSRCSLRCCSEWPPGCTCIVGATAPSRRSPPRCGSSVGVDPDRSRSLDLTPVLDRACRSAPTIVSGFLALAVMCGGRLVWRLRARPLEHGEGDGREPVIVFGAGEGGLQIVSAMIKSGPVPSRLRSSTIDPDLKNLRGQGRPGVWRPRLPGRGRRAHSASARSWSSPSRRRPASSSATWPARADRPGSRTLILPPMADVLGVEHRAVGHPTAHRGRPAGSP